MIKETIAKTLYINGELSREVLRKYWKECREAIEDGEISEYTQEDIDTVNMQKLD